MSRTLGPSLARDVPRRRVLRPTGQRMCRDKYEPRFPQYRFLHESVLLSCIRIISLNFDHSPTAMGFDLTILLLTVAVLMKHEARTDLWRLLFQDGLVYFIVTFTCNAVPAVILLGYLISGSIRLSLSLRSLLS